MSVVTDIDPEQLGYDDRGLLPVVVQDVGSGAVLMLAYANQEAVRLTLETGQAHFWSRSRETLWRKGETSGNVLRVQEMLQDCDSDALLVRALPAGPTCHRGSRSCFEPNPARMELGWLWSVLEERKGEELEKSYTARLLSRGLPRMAQKVGEEATETVIAALLSAVPGDGGVAANAEDAAAAREHLVEEASDLIYHLLVLLLGCGVEPDRLSEQLLLRHRQRAGAGSKDPNSGAATEGEGA